MDVGAVGFDIVQAEFAHGQGVSLTGASGQLSARLHVYPFNAAGQAVVITDVE